MRSNVGGLIEDPDALSELVPEQILPVQFDELVLRSSDRLPELKLMAAVLDDAIRSFCRCTGARKPADRRLFRETSEWFEASDLSWPFSFENICTALALDAGWIRRRLRRWQDSRASATGPANVPTIRRVAGSRTSVTARAQGLRYLDKLAC